METKIVLHIGSAKCASTFLQREVFAKIPGVNLITPDLRNMYFLQPGYENCPNNIVEGKLNIISRENDFGSPSTRPFKCSVNLEYRKKLLGDIKVILITRNKKEWVRSIYNQYVKGGGTYDFKKWFLRVFDLDYLDYEQNVRYVTHLFSNVLILDMEILKMDPGRFVKTICDFIGAEVPDYTNRVYGRRLSDTSLFLLRLINRFLKIGLIYRYFHRRKFQKKILKRPVNRRGL